MKPSPTPLLDFETVRRSAREHEPDRYLSALLAPRAVRDDFIALAAVVGEVNRIPRLVSEPHLAEIRLQWWRDALTGSENAATGNPIADCLNQTIVRHGLPRSLIEAWLEAFAQTLYPGEPADTRALEAEFEAIEGIPFRLAAAIAGTDAPLTVFHDAAVAYGAARLGVNLPYAQARGRNAVPRRNLDLAVSDEPREAIIAARAGRFIVDLSRSALERVKSGFGALSQAQKNAILPVALVEPYLRALERRDHDLTRDVAEIAPLMRVWRLFKAHMTGRI